MFDFFGDVLGQEGALVRLARSLGRSWGEGAMDPGTEDSPTDWGKFLYVRAGFLGDIRSVLEAVREQAFPHLAEHSVETWEAIKAVPPAPVGMLLGDRLTRLLAYCRAIMGSRPADIAEAVATFAGVGDASILERTALQSVLDPERVYEFYTLVTDATWALSDVVSDINEVVDRWKPGHTAHGSTKGPSGPGPAGGVRVADPSDISTPAWFKTGAGPEKTGRNLIQYN